MFLVFVNTLWHFSYYTNKYVAFRAVFLLFYTERIRLVRIFFFPFSYISLKPSKRSVDSVVVFLKFRTSDSPGGLDKTQAAGPHSLSAAGLTQTLGGPACCHCCLLCLSH